MTVPKPTFFATPAAFRRWLQANHKTAAELWVGYYKKSSGRGGLTYPDAVEEALCFGWIDGVGKSFDDISYGNRFTPRRKGSNWSAVNIKRVKALTAAGRMKPAGIKAFKYRNPAKADTYSYEQRHKAKLAPDMVRRFKKNAAAWRFFEALPPGERQMHIFRIMSGKQPETRERKLEELIALCGAGKRIDWMRPMSKQI